MTTVSPDCKRPCSRASCKATITEAADVFPYRSMLTMILAVSSGSFLAAASMIRQFAWCGINSRRSASVRPGAFQDVVHQAGQSSHGEAEDTPAIHAQIMFAGINGLVTGRLPRASSRHLDDLRHAAVAGPTVRQDAQIAAHSLTGLDNQCPGTVPENQSGFLVVVIHHARNQLSADDQGRAADAGAGQPGGGDQGVEGARAPGVEIISWHRRQLQRLLNQIGRRGGDVVRRSGCDDDALNGVMRQPGIGPTPPGRR